jgi:hypothetical protein
VSATTGAGFSIPEYCRPGAAVKVWRENKKVFATGRVQTTGEQLCFVKLIDDSVHPFHWHDISPA